MKARPLQKKTSTNKWFVVAVLQVMAHMGMAQMLPAWSAVHRLASIAVASGAAALVFGIAMAVAGLAAWIYQAQEAWRCLPAQPLQTCAGLRLQVYADRPADRAS